MRGAWDRSEYKILIRKPEGGRPLGRPKCRWKDNIKINCKEIEWKCSYWVHLVQDRHHWQALMNMVIMNLWVS
jgi:hypothetical protein